MKWLKVFLWVFLLQLLFCVVPIFSISGQTTRTLEDLQQEYQKNTERLNVLSIQSEIDLMDLQILLPQLRQEVNALSQEVSQLITESQLLKQDSKKLTQQLTELNTDIEKLSGSLDRIGTLTTDLEKSLKALQLKNNLSLGVAGLSLIGLVYLLIKSFTNKDS